GPVACRGQDKPHPSRPHRVSSELCRDRCWFRDQWPRADASASSELSPLHYLLKARGYKRAKTIIGRLALSIQGSIKEVAVHSVIVNITSAQVAPSYGPIRRSRRSADARS